MFSRKVICVGFQKTGTSSLGQALERLGYRVGGYHDFRHLAKSATLDIEQLRREVLETARMYDAVQDTPYPIFYRDLDRAFPDTKFVLVIRDTDSWIRSVVSDFGSHENAIHTLIYGSPFPRGHEQEWTDRYLTHNTEVVEYFKNRPDALLTLRLDEGDVNWERLCGFLRHPVPDVPWPHANTKRQKAIKLRYWRLLRRLGLRNG